MIHSRSRPEHTVCCLLPGTGVCSNSNLLHGSRDNMIPTHSSHFDDVGVDGATMIIQTF